MKIAIVSTFIALAATFAAPGIAANDHGSHAAMQSSAAQMVDGLVKKVDKSAGKITVSHGPLPNGMPAMTMAFRVKDATWLDQVKNGDKISFMADKVNEAMTIVHLEISK